MKARRLIGCQPVKGIYISIQLNASAIVASLEIQLQRCGGGRSSGALEFYFYSFFVAGSPVSPNQNGVFDQNLVKGLVGWHRARVGFVLCGWLQVPVANAVSTRFQQDVRAGQYNLFNSNIAKQKGDQSQFRARLLYTQHVGARGSLGVGKCHPIHGNCRSQTKRQLEFAAENKLPIGQGFDQNTDFALILVEISGIENGA